jgi:hypothetical protein
MSERYLNMNISSCLMSATSTWSSEKPQTVTLSNAINLYRSSTKTARSCGANSKSLKKPRFPLQGYSCLTQAVRR